MARYLEQITTGRIYPWGPEIAKRNDMRPSDGPAPGASQAAGGGTSGASTEEKPLSRMNKTELADHIHQRFEVALDPGQHTRKQLMDQAVALQKAENEGSGDDDGGDEDDGDE